MNENRGGDVCVFWGTKALAEHSGICSRLLAVHALLHWRAVYLKTNMQDRQCSL